MKYFEKTPFILHTNLQKTKWLNKLKAQLINYELSFTKQVEQALIITLNNIPRTRN